jgi:hypothetical protein
MIGEQLSALRQATHFDCGKIQIKAKLALDYLSEATQIGLEECQLWRLVCKATLICNDFTSAKRAGI